jgi:hypothetical protein
MKATSLLISFFFVDLKITKRLFENGNRPWHKLFKTFSETNINARRRPMAYLLERMGIDGENEPICATFQSEMV